MSKKRDHRAGVSLRAMLSLALGAGAALTATPAMAQEAESEEIVVTATRRDQALQDVPLAVTPVGAEMIQNSGIRDIQDLTSVAPTLQFNVSESEASATARLRGVGTQGSNPGLESAVGIFVDGVYRARNGVALTDLGDLSQIEVLRGPQGTLFGRNTSAGLITITTVLPNLNDYEASGELTYGAFNERRIAGSVNIPLAPGVAGFRIFAAHAERDGFLDTNADGPNPLLSSAENASGGDANSRGVDTVRAQLLWQLTDNLDMRIIGDFSERDETCCAAQIYDPELLNGNPVTNMGPTGVEGAPLPYGSGRQQWIANLGGYGPNVSVATPLGALGDGDIGDRQAFTNYGYPAAVQDRGVSAEFNWDLGGPTLTSISAYRIWTSGGGSDSDYSQTDIVYVPQGGDVGTEYRTFTQELRLAGEWGRVDWLIGAFYSDEEIDRDFAFVTGEQYGLYFSGLDSIISGGTVAPGLGTAPVGGSLSTLYNALALVPAGAGQYDHYEQTGRSLAFFTHNIIALSDRTDLTIGARFTQEEKDLTADFNTAYSAAPLRAATIAGLESAFMVGVGGFAAYNNCNPTLLPGGSAGSAFRALRAGYCVPWLRDELDAVGYDQSRDEEEWSGVVALRHDLTDDLAVYGSFSRGYKAGGFNLDRDFDFTVTPAADDPDSSFEAELVDAYEVGLKTQFFDGRLIANLAIYQNEYENFQLNTYNGIQFVVTSIPEVTAEGAELDLVWRTPIEGLSFQGGVAYTDATYGPNTGWVEANRDPVLANLTLARLPNSQLTNAPEWTATLAATYERPIFNDMRFLAYVDTRWVDDQSTGSDLRPSKLQPEYSLVNARLGIGSADERWTLELWGRNVFDEEYVQIAFDAPLQQGTAGPTQGAFLGDPATYGVTLRAQY